MAKRSKRLSSVAGLYKNEEEKELMAYTKAHQHHLAEIKKLRQLQGFKQDYYNKMQHVGKEGTPSLSLQNYLQFIEQLDEAIIKQKKQVEQAEALGNIARNRYILAKQKSDAMQKVVDKALVVEKAVMNKQEQKENDEQGQNQWYSGKKSDD